MNAKVILIVVPMFAMNLSVVGCTFEQYDTAISSAVISQNRQGYPVQGEIRQSYQISPRGVIEVSGIEGSVEVETTNDSKAELHFVRYARTQNDYDCETIVVESLPNRLVISHRTKSECRIIQAYEKMKLVVPRSANLNFKKIEGDFTIGKTEGFLQLKSIEGSVKVAEAQAAKITSVEGNVMLNIARIISHKDIDVPNMITGIDQRVIIDNVEGDVELALSGDLNADLRIERVEGDVKSDFPSLSKFGYKSYLSQLGTGGPEIKISGIEGDVRIRRL